MAPPPAVLMLLVLLLAGARAHDPSAGTAADTTTAAGSAAGLVAGRLSSARWPAVGNSDDEDDTEHEREPDWPGDTTLRVEGVACEVCNGYYSAKGLGSDGKTLFRKHRSNPGTPEPKHPNIQWFEGGNEWDLGVKDKWGAYVTPHTILAPDGVTAYPSADGWTHTSGCPSGSLPTGTPTPIITYKWSSPALPPPPPPPPLTWPGNTTLHVQGGGCDTSNGYYYEVPEDNGINITIGFRSFPPGPGATDIHRNDGRGEWVMGATFVYGTYMTEQSVRGPDGSTFPSTMGWTTDTAGAQCGSRDRPVVPLSCGSDGSGCAPLPTLTYKPPAPPTPPPPGPPPSPSLAWPGNTTLHVQGGGCETVNGYYYEVPEDNGINITIGFRSYPPGPGGYLLPPGATDIHRNDGSGEWVMGAFEQWGTYVTEQSVRGPDGSMFPGTLGWGAYAQVPQCGSSDRPGLPPRSCGSDGSGCAPLPTLTYKPLPVPEPEPEPEPTPGPAGKGACDLLQGAPPAYKAICNAQKTRVACKLLKQTCRWEDPHPHPRPQPGPHSKPVPPPPAPKRPWRAFVWTLLVVAVIVLCCGGARFCIQRRRDKEKFPTVASGSGELLLPEDSTSPNTNRVAAFDPLRESRFLLPAPTVAPAAGGGQRLLSAQVPPVAQPRAPPQAELPAGPSRSLVASATDRGSPAAQNGIEYRYCRVLKDYTAGEGFVGYLDLRAGQLIAITDSESDASWWSGFAAEDPEQKVGEFPQVSVEVLQPGFTIDASIEVLSPTQPKESQQKQAFPENTPSPAAVEPASVPAANVEEESEHGEPLFAEPDPEPEPPKKLSRAEALAAMAAPAPQPELDGSLRGTVTFGDESAQQMLESMRDV